VTYLINTHPLAFRDFHNLHLLLLVLINRYALLFLQTTFLGEPLKKMWSGKASFIKIYKSNFKIVYKWKRYWIQ